jgi:poly(A) polymerase Pap1
MDKKKAEYISISELLYSFFNTWADWPWPTPVNLNSYIPGFHGSQVNIRDLVRLIQCVNNAMACGLMFVYNLFLKDDFEGAYLPILTPCYPVVNASPFVKKSTFDVILGELKRGNLFVRACVHS